MKYIFLFSSIFYLLGLKIGHKIDLFKNDKSVEKISSAKEITKPVTGTIHFGDEVQTQNDSTTNCETTSVLNKSKIEESHF